VRRKTQKREKGRQEDHKKEIDLLFVFQCCDGIGDRCFYRLVADSEKCDNPGNTPCQEKCFEADPGAVGEVLEPPGHDQISRRPGN